jgi:hypothetical protein
MADLQIATEVASSVPTSVVCAKAGLHDPTGSRGVDSTPRPLERRHPQYAESRATCRFPKVRSVRVRWTPRFPCFHLVRLTHSVKPVGSPVPVSPSTCAESNVDTRTPPWPTPPPSPLFANASRIASGADARNELRNYSEA